MNRNEYTPARPEIQGHDITRRSALASLGALALAASSTTAMARAVEAPSGAAVLIAAYLKLYAEHCDAEKVREALTDKLAESLKQDPVTVELGDYYGGEVFVDDGLVIYESAIQSRTRTRIDKLLTFRQFDEPAVAIADAFKQEIEREAAAFAAMRQGRQVVEARARAIGLRDAEEAVDLLDAALVKAWDDILNYRPQSLAEVWELFDFYRSDSGFGADAYPTKRNAQMIFAALSTPEIVGRG